MTDFSKDELQIILLDMQININQASPLSPSPCYLELKDKVQAMVDNYCEIDIPTVSDYCCEKCNEVWLECECGR